MHTLSSSKPKARKEHKCDFCYGKIHPGEKYSNSFNIHDGETYSFKSHLLCLEMITVCKMKDDYDEGISHDHWLESIRDEYQDVNPEYDRNEDKEPSITDQIKSIAKHHRLEIPKGFKTGFKGG